jgi:hypothetical protein
MLGRFSRTVYGKDVAKVADRQLGSARDWARGVEPVETNSCRLIFKQGRSVRGDRKKEERERKVRDEAQNGKLRGDDACFKADHSK